MPLDIAPIRQRDQDWFHDPRGNQTVAEVVRDRGDLLVEVEHLRAAIAEHRDQVTSWNIANREPAPADKALWASLDPE